MFRTFCKKKYQNIHLNYILLKIVKISLQKQNFPGNEITKYHISIVLFYLRQEYLIYLSPGLVSDFVFQSPLNP